MSILAIKPSVTAGIWKSIPNNISMTEKPLGRAVGTNLSEITELNGYYQTITNGLKIKNAKKVLNILNRKSENGTQMLTGVDENWLSVVRRYFGRNNFTVNNPDNPSEILNVNSRLTVSAVNEAENGFDNLRNALHTMVSASKYKPYKKTLNGVDYKVHNSFIASNMKTIYDENSLKNITDYLEKQRMFDLTDDPKYGFVIDKASGLIKTCGASENWEMGDRLWVTDSMRVGDIQKYKRPETWTKSLTTISKFYEKQVENFKRIIDNPSLYREGDAMEGVPHIFLPKTLDGDPNWFNNKRLESPGLALKEMAKAVLDGIVKNKEYGFKSANEVPESVLKTMEYLSKYFKAIDYPTAPSAGNWEEIPLKGGLTWDTEAIRSGLEALRNLAYNPKYSTNTEIAKVRAKLNIDDEKTLLGLIKRGEERVRRTYLAEAPEIRENDSSLAFITTSNIRLANSLKEDISKHVQILDKLDKELVRDNGIIRYAPFNFKLKDGSTGYSPDSYLNLNYFNAVDNKGKINLKWKEILDKFGSKDASEPEVFNARAKLSSAGKEAEWFMVSEMSTGYGNQLIKLLKSIKGQKPNADEAKLVEKLRLKQSEYLNRALARISDENPSSVYQYKANGLEMPKVTIPEAYQHVSDTTSTDKILPGANAPLSWALASLYKALNTQKVTINMLK